MNVRVKDFIKGDKLRRYMLMDNSADILILDFVILKDGLLGLIKHNQMMCLDRADAERNLETMKIRGWKEQEETKVADKERLTPGLERKIYRMAINYPDLPAREVYRILEEGLALTNEEMSISLKDLTVIVNKARKAKNETLRGSQLVKGSTRQSQGDQS